MGAASITLLAQRVRDDDISSPNGTPTWLSTENSATFTAVRGTGTANSFVIRALVDETANKVWLGTFTLNYNHEGAGATPVTATSTHVKMYGATSRGGISDDAAITSKKLAATQGTGTWEDGVCDTATGTISETTAKDGYTEHEWVVYIDDAQVANADEIEFTITGQDVTDAAVNWPTVTVSKSANQVAEPPQGSVALTGLLPTADLSDHQNVTVPVGSIEFATGGLVPDVIDEKFETDPGFDFGGWVGPTESGASTFDEDYPTSSVTGAPGDWGDLCAEVAAVVAPADAYIRNTITEIPVVYYGIDLIVASSGETQDTWCGLSDIYSTDFGFDPFHFDIIWDDVNGLRLQVNVKYDGTSNLTYHDLSYNTKIRAEVYWNVTANEWAYRIDEIEQASGAISGAALGEGVSILSVGTGGQSLAVTYYIDNVALSTEGWAGASTVPTIDLSWEQTIPVGSVALTGYVPTVEAIADENVNVEVPVGSVTLAGEVPTPGWSGGVTVPVGAVTTTGYVPTVVNPTGPTVPEASVTLTGYVPTVTTTEHQAPEVPVGAGAFTGYEPSWGLSWEQTVAVGALALVGLVPTVSAGADQNVEVPVASVDLTGYAPTVAVSDNISVEIPAGTVTFSGLAPTVELEVATEIPVGSASLTGYAPTVELPVVVTVPHAPDVGAHERSTIEFAGYAPTVTIAENVSTEIPVGSITATGYAPTVDLEVNTVVPAGLIYFDCGAVGRFDADDIKFDSDLRNLDQHIGLGCPPTINTGGNVSVTVPVGSASLTGYVPTAETPVDVTVPVGSVSLTGYAPIADVEADVTVPVGALTISTYVSTIDATGHVWVEVPAGAIEFDCGAVGRFDATDIKIDSTLRTADQDLGLGCPPTIGAIADVDITVPVGSVGITGYIPTADLQADVEIPVGSASFTGYAPTVDLAWSGTIPVGSLSLTGLAPTIELEVEIPQGTINLTGYAPTVDISVSATIPTGSITITGQQPTVISGDAVDVLVDPGSITLTGQVPTIDQVVNQTIPVGSIGITGYAPTPSTTGHQWVEIPVGSLTLTGQVPTVAADASVTVEIPHAPDMGAHERSTIEFTGYAPTPATTANVSIEIPVGSITLSGTVPTLDLSWEQVPPVGSVGLTGYAPVIDISDASGTLVPTGAITLAGLAPTIDIPWSDTIPVGSLALTGLVPTIAVSDALEVEVPVGSITLTGLTSTVTASDHQAVEIPVGSLTLSGLVPTPAISDNQSVTIPVGSVTLSGLVPTADFTADVSVTIPTGTLTFAGAISYVGATWTGVMPPLGVVLRDSSTWVTVDPPGEVDLEDSSTEVKIDEHLG